MAADKAGRSARVKREVLVLVMLVLLLDGLFIGGYFVSGVGQASTAMKLAYMGAWTVATMVVVLRGLSRLRAIRSGQ